MRQKQLDEAGTVVDDRFDPGKSPAQERPQRFHPQQQQGKQQPDPKYRAR
jgi:hypothetical protein